MHGVCDVSSYGHMHVGLFVTEMYVCIERTTEPVEIDLISPRFRAITNFAVNTWAKCLPVCRKLQDEAEITKHVRFTQAA